MTAEDWLLLLGAWGVLFGILRPLAAHAYYRDLDRRRKS
jgi:hypothetical protein